MSQVVEINGKPAARVSVGAAEKINTGNFSNVDISASVERYVEDDPAIIDAELRRTLEDHVEPFLAGERDRIIALISGQGGS